MFLSINNGVCLRIMYVNRGNEQRSTANYGGGEKSPDEKLTGGIWANLTWNRFLKML